MKKCLILESASIINFSTNGDNPSEQNKICAQGASITQPANPHCAFSSTTFESHFMKNLIAIAVLASSLVGCASVNMGDAQQDAALKTFAPVKDKTGVYIYRNESMGAAIKMNVELDGQAIGQTAANTYLYKEVTPGKHTITSRAENDSSIEVDAQPGTLLYVWQEVKMGILGARSKLQIVDQAQGQKGVQETKLAETK
ncbi:DUF2846 domain-containing protein [Rhodoferax lithotrophicus]|nr:DUF2846 domain-containing protein [Rhodoferax sp. MIZ03]